MSEPYQGQSTDKDVPGVFGQNIAGGAGVAGSSIGGDGVRGLTDEKDHSGVFGQNTAGGAGVAGWSTGGDGVRGLTDEKDHSGVFGQNTVGGAGVQGWSTGGDGVVGRSTSNGRGVAGFSETWQGVYGHSVTQAGVVGESEQFDGVFGISHSNQHAGVTGNNTAGGMAGFFGGNVVVTGDIQMLGGDVAEDFDVEEDEEIPPGAVVSLGESGSIRLARRPYDTAIIGIVSGAVGFRPALLLDRISTGHSRLPVALVGKVMCLVDASSSPVRAGDLLTSSVTPGYAMRAEDAHQSVGAIVGKALRSLDRGQALLPVLAILQ